jgi:hypothetical protein
MYTSRNLALGRALLILVVLAALGMLRVAPAAAADHAASPLPFKGFACCTLHYEKDWISDGNYAILPSIPAGTPITVLRYGRHKAYAEINGRPMRLGHDYGREQESLDQWVHKIVVDVDPTAKIAAYAPDIQAAIRQGRVMIGMTREQAVIAVGYPLTSETLSLDSPLWRHWVSSFEEYQLMWGSDGLIREISAVDTVRNVIVYQPAR